MCVGADSLIWHGWNSSGGGVPGTGGEGTEGDTDDSQRDSCETQKTTKECSAYVNHKLYQSLPFFKMVPNILI